MEPLSEYRTEMLPAIPRPPLVVLPSGCVVNLARVAFVSAPAHDAGPRIIFADTESQVWLSDADHAALIDAIAPMEDMEPMPSDARWVLAPRCVTVAEYRAFCEATGREWDGARGADWQEDWPCNVVSALDADAYCDWRTAQSAPTRLPTEAEWVAGTPPDWTIGDENERNGRAVWEWTADLSDPTAPDGPRVLRGGSWFHNQVDARAAYRVFFHPGERDWYFGFRVVVAAPVAGAPGSGARPLAALAPLPHALAGEAGG